MNLKIGIVGLANVGKSTLFNALLKRHIAFVANYPFSTIEPNIGVVPVPDDRLGRIADIIEKEEGVNPPIHPATVEFVDIAGLVKGASEGQGLGNKFLAHIREVHIICHVIRYFPNPNVVHVAGSIDPKRDKETIETELILADLQTLEKQKGKFDDLKKALNEGKLAKDIGIDTGELQLLTSKPMLIVANISESQIPQIPQIPQIDLAICAETESQLAELSDTEQKEYLQSLGLEASGLDRLIQKAYEMLGLISFFTTVGAKEVRAWTLKKGTKAPQAAGVIHTDFEKKFIKADVATFDDFIAVGGWKKAREEGKVRSEGKEYAVRDGDVIEFKIGT